MPQPCSVCRHPEKASIEESLLRNKFSLRILASRVGVSPWALHRHKAHLAIEVVKAIEISGAASILSRVEGILAEVKEVTAAARARKDWNAAIAALREERACIGVIGRVTGEITSPQGGNLHLHKHVTITSKSRDEFAVEREIAKHVAAATNNFDPAEIARLKALAGVIDVVGPKQQSPQMLESEGGL